MIRFWRTTDAYGVFSNFAKTPFVDDTGTRWQTVEHYYQAYKSILAGRPDYAWLVKQAQTPKEAANLGRRGPMPENWNNIKVNVMRTALKFKFSDPALALTLETCAGPIVEDSPIDWYWGCGRDEKGLNMLGVLLMELRSKLRGKNRG